MKGVPYTQQSIDTVYERSTIHTTWEHNCIQLLSKFNKQKVSKVCKFQVACMPPSCGQSSAPCERMEEGRSGSVEDVCCTTTPSSLVHIQQHILPSTVKQQYVQNWVKGTIIIKSFSISYNINNACFQYC